MLLIAGTRVLRSASELFAAIKKSLLRCSKYITRGPAMLSLMGAFQVASVTLPIKSPLADANTTSAVMTFEF